MNTDNITVYILENDEYTPYLVITDNYNNSGNCLLLRHYLLDDSIEYSHYGTPYPSYYDGSIVDNYLSNEFYSSLSEYTASVLRTSDIEITDKESIGCFGDGTHKIQRNVFLLSYSEIDRIAMRAFPYEGKQIAFFNSDESRIAYHSDGTADVWWLRTPDFARRSTATVVRSDGVISIVGLYSPGYNFSCCLRPAFCIDGSTALKTVEINGNEVFSIE